MNSLELLEPRIAPALIAPTVTKGVLFIQHDTTGTPTAENIVVAQTGPDAFTVQDTIAGGAAVPVSGVKSIVVQVADLGDNIELTFSHDGLAGKLDITTTGGTNNIKLGSTDLLSGMIAGKVTIHTGGGDDTLTIHTGLAIAAPVLFDGGDGSDTFTPDNAFLAKKLTLQSVEDITTQNALNPVVIGGMLVENEDANGPVTFVLSQVAAITGPLTYCGSATVTDEVTLNGEFTGPVKLMLLGGTNNVTTAGTFLNGVAVTGGSGPDTVVFKSVSVNAIDSTNPPFITANVAGTVAMSLGDGINTVTLQDGSFFAKDVSVTTGAGMDTVNFTKFVALKNVKLVLGKGANSLNGAANGVNNFIGGNFKYTGGLDVDSVKLDGLIAGNINVVLGDGANDVTGDARIIGKSASFTGGAGVDTINISLGSTAGTLSAKLGDGNDSFTFTGGALASAKLDGGAGDSDKLTGSALLPAVRKIVGFEP